MSMYVLHVKSGSEMTVIQELKHIGVHVIVPQEVVIYRKGGKWHTKERLLFPGYAFADFVNADLTADNYYAVKSCTGVIRFLGASEPEPLPETEEKYIRIMDNGGHPLKPSLAYITLDKQIIPASGILSDMGDRIVKHKVRQRRATIEFEIGGQKIKTDISCRYIR